MHQPYESHRTEPAGRHNRSPGRSAAQSWVGSLYRIRSRLQPAAASFRSAAAADVSIGALYRFFPDKQSIIDAVAVRHVGNFRSGLQLTVMPIVERQFENLATFDPALILDLVIDAYVAYLLEHPDFRAISFGQHISASTHARESSPQTGLPSLLKNFMLERLGIPNTPELDLKLRVISEAGERLIAYAFEQPTDDERDRIIAEMKQLLAGYLFAGD